MTAIAVITTFLSQHPRTINVHCTSPTQAYTYVQAQCMYVYIHVRTNVTHVSANARI